MKPRISFVTLGVRDFNRARTFYRDGLGFPLRENSTDDVAFFDLDGGRQILSLFGRDELAEDAAVASAGSGFRAFSLAHNVESPEEVERVLALAVDAGAKLTKPGQKTFWGGYAGYFEDPEGVLWEVAHNPFMDLG